MNKRLDEFLDLSVALTGFDRLHLLGTGVAAEYLGTLDTIVTPAVVDAMLQAFAGLPAADADGALLAKAVMEDAQLGPVARNLIVLWYSGTWTPLPTDWPGPRSASDTGHVVSPAAYFSGLQWSAVAAHPPGALPPGFASWALPPLGVEA